LAPASEEVGKGVWKKHGFTEQLLGFLKARHTTQLQVTRSNQHILYNPMPPLVQLVSLGNTNSACVLCLQLPSLLLQY
jgi:hypothetical protein